ncbi:MAG: tryptophan synthase subunit alpha [Methanobacteriota archaeon]|nr:MAG: tryptophan synthase subunit alpha [Euryarchaeota archaeon]
MPVSRIKDAFRRLEERKERALIAYLTLGDPDPAASLELLTCLAEEVDLLELGIPFSDPIADGPTIQAAMERALSAGMTTEESFQIAKGLRAGGVEIPLIFMTYYNIVLQYGVERFVERCASTGVDGLLVSDLPVEESEALKEVCERHGVDLIFLIAPTTSEERMEEIVSRAGGFIYLVSLLGVTGERERLQERALEMVEKALRHTGSLPLVVGFGISKREHVEAIVRAGAQGVVVGSAFVRLVEEHGREACSELRRLARDLKEGTRGP